MSSLLKQAFNIISDKNLFHVHGSKADQETIKQLLQVIIQTKVGRQLIVKIGALLQQDPQHRRINIGMIRPNDKNLGLSDENLNIQLVRIGNQNMTPFQRHKTELMQSLTLIHELEHIDQVLRGSLEQASEFSFPFQAYIHVLHEAEATLFERKLLAEFRKLYPRLTRTLQDPVDKFNRPRDLVRSFFVKKDQPFRVLSGLDVFAENMKNSQYILLKSAPQKKAFTKWVNTKLSRMNIPLRYQQIPLEKTFWVQETQDHHLIIGGWDSLAEFDSDWRLIALSSGFEKGRETALNISLFTYKGQKKQLTNLLNEIQTTYPRAKIYLVKGLEENNPQKAAKNIDTKCHTR